MPDPEPCRCADLEAVLRQVQAVLTRHVATFGDAGGALAGLVEEVERVLSQGGT